MIKYDLEVGPVDPGSLPSGVGIMQALSIQHRYTKKRQKNNDWSFSELTQGQTLWGPHGYHRYPAKFIPQLVRRIIDEYSTTGSLIVDPFVGSATT